MEKAYKLEFTNEKTGSLFVNNCGCSRTEKLHSFGPALKPNFLIHYILSGKGVFRINGIEYHLKEHNGFLIPPGELAFYQSDESDPWTYVWVGFGGSLAEAYTKELGLSLRNPVFTSEDADEIYETVTRMMECNTYGIKDELGRNGLLYMFLSKVASKNMVLRGQSEEEKANNYVRRAVDFIQINYCNPIKVTDIAEYVCVNRSYLYTLFERSLDMSPKEFLAQYRITKAAELLLSTQLSIESIAFSCGYSDAMVFAKAFKLVKGSSPTSFRKNLKEGGRRNKEHLQQVNEFIEQIQRLQKGK